jgi:chaperonin cofactor prefoldin
VARESNKAVIFDLKEKLDLLNKNIQMLNEKDEFLTNKIKEME